MGIGQGDSCSPLVRLAVHHGQLRQIAAGQDSVTAVNPGRSQMSALTPERTTSAPPSRGDDGFTLVELVVAMLVIAVVLTALIGLQLGSMRTVALAKQRQQATALSNQVMERVRALPLDVVKQGLNSGDLTGDPNITGANFTPTYDAAIIEPLVLTNSQAQEPLYPHVQAALTSTVDDVHYDVRSYITLADGSTVNGFMLSTIVSWSSPATGGITKTEAVRSRLFSPAGCLSTTNHPFSGPCQAFLYGSGGTTTASVQIRTATTGQAPVVGLPMIEGDLLLPALTTNAQLEQTVSGLAKITTSGARSDSTLSGQVSSNAQADTDPGTGVLSMSQQYAVSQSATALTSSGAGGTFTFTPSLSDTGTVVGASTSTATPACADSIGTAFLTGQVCASSFVQAGGGSSAVLDLGDIGGRDLPAMTLLSMASPSAPTHAFSARMLAATSVWCVGTSGIGCMATGAARTIGDVAIGRLPATSGEDLSLPAGFTGMVRMTGYADKASTQAGVGIAASTTSATAQRTGGTLTYWGANDAMNTVSLTGVTASVTYPLGTVIGTYRLTGTPEILITMTGTVTLRPVDSTFTGTPGCQNAACVLKASSGSIQSSITYRITSGGIEVGHFIVATDLGALVTSSTYKAAPSA